eukprot:s2217_g6.t1
MDEILEVVATFDLATGYKTPPGTAAASADASPAPRKRAAPATIPSPATPRYSMPSDSESVPNPNPPKADAVKTRRTGSRGRAGSSTSAVEPKAKRGRRGGKSTATRLTPIRYRPDFSAYTAEAKDTFQHFAYSPSNRPANTARCAVAEGGEQCGAVRAWLDEFVIGRGFCPWARPAEKRRNIRIVESTGKDPEEVIFDLLAEAEALPEGTGFDGEATTTLVVCPYVEDWGRYQQHARSEAGGYDMHGYLLVEWKEYGPFRDFYEEELEGGSGFLEEFDMKVIAFHPKYLRYGFSVEEGDRVAIANSASGRDAQELLDVRFDDGQEFLVRYSSIITKLAVDDDGEERAADDSSGDAANLLSRAPRPTFHLLRMEDLEGASDAAPGPRDAVGL